LGSLRKVRVGYTQAELDEKVRKGEFQVHKFPLGFVMTEIRQFPEEKILIVQLLGGERFKEWAAEVVAHLRLFAHENGCEAIEATCRKGLEPILKPLGWKRTRVVLRSEI
jgi:hypothetical protein